MYKEYWEKYYNIQDGLTTPSPFALYVLQNHLQPGNTLLELGCGNGRDSVFFAKHDIYTHAIDQCEEILSTLHKNNTLPNLKFEINDFTNLDDGRGLFDHIYSRFTMHTIKTEEEDRVIDWVYRNLKKGGKFHIEARGLKNEIYKLGSPVEGEIDAYIYNDHFRRFINLEKFIEKLKERGFEIHTSEEKTGFAPFEDTDYHFIRVIASK